MSDLTTFTYNGVKPFHSPRNTADECFTQAMALTSLLSAAHDVCEEAGEQAADPFASRRHRIHASGLDAIETLIAFGMSQLEAADEDRRRERAASQWSDLVEVYEEALLALKTHNANYSGAAFGTRECEAYEAETARLADAYHVAAEALLETPVPDAKSIAVKLKVLTTREFAGDADAFASGLSHLKRDADAVLA